MPIEYWEWKDVLTISTPFIPRLRTHTRSTQKQKPEIEWFFCAQHLQHRQQKPENYYVCRSINYKPYICAITHISHLHISTRYRHICIRIPFFLWRYYSIPRALPSNFHQSTRSLWCSNTSRRKYDERKTFAYDSSYLEMLILVRMVLIQFFKPFMENIGMVWKRHAGMRSPPFPSHLPAVGFLFFFYFIEKLVWYVCLHTTMICGYWQLCWMWNLE